MRHERRGRRRGRSEVVADGTIEDGEDAVRPRSRGCAARGDLAEDELRVFGRAHGDAADGEVGNAVAVDVGEPVVARGLQVDGRNELRRDEVEISASLGADQFDTR